MMKRTAVKLSERITILTSILVATFITGLIGINVRVDSTLAKQNLELKEGEKRDIAEDCNILNYVDESEFRLQNHVERMYDQESLNTYVFKNGDGTNSVYFFDDNLKYRDESGSIIEKDLSLVRVSDAYTVKSNDVQVKLPVNIKNGVKISYLDNLINVTPVAKQMSDAINKNSYIEYKNVFGKGINLRYSPMLSGLKEDIVVESFSNLSKDNITFSFELTVNGQIMMEDEEGYYLEGESNGEKIRLGNVMMYDANNSLGIGTINVKTVSEGEKYIISIIPDMDYLKNSDTVYPVTIDPSITISDNTHGANAIVDAPVFSGFPAQNFGTYVYDRVGKTTDSFKIGRTAIRLSGMTSTNVYKNATAANISSVKFYVKESSGASTQTIKLHPLTSNTTWTESNITWNNIGSYDTSVNYGNTMSNAQWTSFDITNLVKAWKNGTYSAKAGFIMKNQNEANNESFFSSEYSTTSYRPYVVLTYIPTIRLKYSSVTMSIGQTQIFEVNACIPDSYSVKWLSSNTRIATVNVDTGLVTAKASGEIKIKAYCPQDSSLFGFITLKVSHSGAPTTGISSGEVYMVKNVSKGTYLRANSLTNVSLVSKNEMDGKQLWYVVLTSTGYKLYSMGIKDIYTGGANDTLLRGYTKDMSPRIANDGNVYGGWSISYNGGYYYLTNVHDDYNDTSISANATDNNVKSVSLNSETNYARWRFEKIEKSTFNNYWEGDYIGQAGNARYIKFIIDSTGDDSVYLNDVFQEEDFDVIDDWKNKSSNIIIYGPNDTVPPGIAYTGVTFKGKIFTLEGGGFDDNTMGETWGIDNFGNDMWWYDNWNSIIIYLNVNAGTVLDGSDEENYRFREKTILHEMGHAQKLAHPMQIEDIAIVLNGRGGYSSNTSVVALMNQWNPMSSSNLTCRKPKLHDLINLNNKWE